MRPYSSFLCFASFILVGSLVFSCSLSGCSRQEQDKPATPAPKAVPVQPAAPAVKPPTVSVDFDNVPLAEVVVFVTGQTGKGFTFAGNESKPITWIEYHIERAKVLDSFKAALAASGLTLKPGNPEETLFVIEQPEEVKVPCKLDFASSKRGTFFLFDATIYPKETFPFPLQQQGGHWYALVPKSVADRLAAASQHAAQ